MAGIFAIAAAYFASSSLALILTRFDGGIAVMWPASALLFAKPNLNTFFGNIVSIQRYRWSRRILSTTFGASFEFWVRCPSSEHLAQLAA